MTSESFPLICVKEMTMRKFINIAVVSVITAAFIFGPASVATRAADHLDAPLVDTDGRIDITDVYAFAHGSNTVLIMNVDPLAGVISPTGFRSNALYEFRIDNTGDAVPDVVYRLHFSGPNSSGRQNVTLKRATGNQARSGNGGTIIATGVTGKTVSVSGGGKLFAGARDDPFFFDLAAFKKFSTDGNPADFCAPGSNFFAGVNVASMVLEVPTASLLGSSAPIIFPWATVSLQNSSGNWVQVERMGKPALATVFIKPTGGANSDAYNATTPNHDLAQWGSFFPANPIPLLGGISVRNLLLPDVLILNTSGPLVINNIPFAGYPNGRRLEDDVIDTSFTVLANAGVLPASVTSDCVANDSSFSSTFPYVAAPN
jgi:uncharacterized protein DUF4331